VENMARYYVSVYLDSFISTKSGDIVGKGEFYFKCNSKRFPDKGTINLGANQLFDPEPNPTFYTALVEEKEKKVKFDIEVWEEDPGLDDKFLVKKFEYPIKTMNETIVLKDPKGICQLKLILKMQETKDW
jgi:hypothetical protein